VRCKRPDTGRRSGRQRVVQFTDDLFSTKAANNMRKEAQIRVAQRHTRQQRVIQFTLVAFLDASSFKK